MCIIQIDINFFWNPKNLILMKISVFLIKKFSFNFVFNFLLQIFFHLGIAWDLRWATSPRDGIKFHLNKPKVISEPAIPTMDQVF